jgi:hypothetical protein
MTNINGSQTVRNFVTLGLQIISKIGEFRDLEAAVVKTDEIRHLQEQLQAAESALQDEIAHSDRESVQFALRAGLSVSTDLEIRFDVFSSKVQDLHEVGDFKVVMDSVWPRENLETLNKRLATIRAASRWASSTFYSPLLQALNKE